MHYDIIIVGAGLAGCHNDLTIPGFGFAQFTHAADGERQTIYDLLIKPLLERHRNLESLHSTSAHRVKVKNNLCTGVILADGTEISSTEVILTAGAYHTPKILQHSNIGPKNVLESLGISCNVDLPVGEGLKDDLIYFESIKLTNFAIAELGKVEEYLSNMDLNAFFDADGNPVREDAKFQIQTYLLREGWGGYVPKNSYGVGVILLHPKSCGRVYIGSNDPNKAPIIDPNFLAEPEDITMLLKGAALLKKIIAALPDELFVKPEVHSSAEISIDSIRDSVFSDSHPVGTCSRDRVVDFHGKVLGIENLSCADASVLPTQTGNPQIAVRLEAMRIATCVLTRMQRKLSEKTRDYRTPVNAVDVSAENLPRHNGVSKTPQ